MNADSQANINIQTPYKYSGNDRFLWWTMAWNQLLYVGVKYGLQPYSVDKYKFN